MGLSDRGLNVTEATTTATADFPAADFPAADFHGRALRRARRSERGRPGVLAWLAGLCVHFAVVLLLVV